MTTSTPAPRAQDYSVVPGLLGPRRDFRISVGLREGWDADGRVFDVSEAARTARAWMQRRVEAGQPALSGMFTRAEVTYAWPLVGHGLGAAQCPFLEGKRASRSRPLRFALWSRMSVVGGEATSMFHKV